MGGANVGIAFATLGDGGFGRAGAASANTISMAGSVGGIGGSPCVINSSAGSTPRRCTSAVPIAASRQCTFRRLSGPHGPAAAGSIALERHPNTAEAADGRRRAIAPRISCPRSLRQKH